MKMEVRNMPGSSLIVQRTRSNQAVHSPGLDKSGSFNTVTTSDEISLCDDFASPGKGKSPISNVSRENISTPSKKKSMMTMSATNKNHKAPEINLSNEDSFKESDDSNWWQSPKVPKDGDVADLEEKPSSQPDHSTEYSEDVTDVGSEKANTSKKPSDKKKKVKRISMIKVKACDLGSLTAHQFTKSGDFATDQKELQKALMQWKAEQKGKASGSTSRTEGDGSDESKKRSKSKLRGAKEETEKSDEPLHRRSRSTGRRSSETDVVDLTSEDKRSKSVSRKRSDIASGEKSRSRSVARKENSKGEDQQKSGEKSEIRSRGRSVGAKRSGTDNEEKTRGKSLVRTLSGKATRERSRSVARQRPCEETEDDEIKDNSVARTRSGDLESGLKKVDRDTRSRSVARQRPNEEDINSHANSAHSHHSSRSKTTAKSEKASESIQSDQSGSTDGSEKRRRSKSLIRKTRKLEENYLAPSRGRSSGNEPVSSDDEGTRRKRSASVGAGLTRANEKTENSNTSQANHDGKKDPHQSPSKSIPWTEFLMHAQSTTCS